ncbi:MAG: hypothetical protein P9X27_04395 [Candidatus Kaelpia aquatica]|nr:hypothetical protein [Candidatus Kaelpia aquatica]
MNRKKKMFKTRQQESFFYSINKILIKDFISIVVACSMLFANTICLAGDEAETVHADGVFTTMPMAPAASDLMGVSLIDQTEIVAIERVGVLRIEEFNVGFQVTYMLNNGAKMLQSLIVYLPIKRDENEAISVPDVYIETPEISEAGFRGESWNINPGDDSIGYLEIVIVNNGINLITEYAPITDTAMGIEFTYDGATRGVYNHDLDDIDMLNQCTSIVKTLNFFLNLEDFDSNSASHSVENPSIDNPSVDNESNSILDHFQTFALRFFPALFLGGTLAYEIYLQQQRWIRRSNE